MSKSNLFMPSSQEHCEGCAFAGLDPATEQSVAQAERELIYDHLHETFGAVCSTAHSSKRVQEAALDRGIDARRLLAARVCASTIQRGDCQDYIFINRGRGHRPQLEERVKI